MKEKTPERNEAIRRAYYKELKMLKEIAWEYGLTKGRIWQIVNQYDTNMHGEGNRIRRTP